MTTLRKGNIRLALQSLSSNKGRSFLTMMGIIIGVAAVIVVVSIGEGVKQQIGAQTARFGKDVLMVRASSNRSGSAASSFIAGSTRSLSKADIETVRSTSGVAQAVPVGTAVGAVQADHVVDDPFVVATTVDFIHVVKHPIEYGGFFDPDEGSRTAVLGSSLALKLFDDTVPLGQSFTYRGEKFMVAGVFKRFAVPPLSTQSDYNEAIFIPYSTARSILGVDPETPQVLAKAAAGSSVETVAQSIETRLVAAHGGTHDVVVESAKGANDSSDETLRLLTMMTLGVALVAFLVGGVGIMNVMLVSVTERTQEVGLRKAIGATNQQILRQFIAEALVLSVIGAIIGVVLALVTVGFMRLYTTLQPVPVWPVVGLVPVVAIASGVLFGTFPAAKAARKDPIEALRHQ